MTDETKTEINVERLREAFWEEDKKNGSIIKKQYDEIKAVLESKDISWAEEQLKQIKKHAIEETEFYKNFDVNDEFPVMNKSLFIDNMEKCKARKGFDGPIHITSTSGSTGTPFTVIQDNKKRKRTIADLKVYGELCDYPSHERMIFFRVLNEKLKRTKEQEEKENIFYIDSSILDKEHLEQMRQIILEKRPRIIFSYSSTLVELAKYIAGTNSSAKDFSMKAVLCAGEGVSVEDRIFMEEVFGCTVYRRYSNMEMGIMGQDFGMGGSYHLNYGSYYFECLKLDSDDPAEEEEVGRIVVTDLFNYAFPMIRYDTGDLGIMKKKQGEFPVFTEIFGRRRDCVYTPDGKLLSPAKISTSMWGIEGVKQWQFIQKTKNEYVVRLNSRNPSSAKIIMKKLQDILGENAVISVQMEDDIAVLASNKRRAIVNEYVL